MASGVFAKHVCLFYKPKNRHGVETKGCKALTLLYCPKRSEVWMEKLYDKGVSKNTRSKLEAGVRGAKKKKKKLRVNMLQWAHHLPQSNNMILEGQGLSHSWTELIGKSREVQLIA